MPLEGIDVRTGRKVKLIGSVVDSATSAASSAASSAAGAASGAASAATSAATSAANAVTGVLSSLTGCGPSPNLGAASLGASGGAPSAPSGKPPSSIGPNSYPSDLTGAVAAAAFASSGSPSPPTGPSPNPGTTEAAVAAAVAAATLGSPVPPGSPTTLEVWVGTFQVPVFNTSLPLPPCNNAVHRGQFGVLKGNGTSDDRAIMCLEEPTKGGWGYYPFPTSERIVTDVFSGNGTGLVCASNYCSITAYPNGTLFSLDGVTVVNPGTCSFCSMQVDKYGRVIAFSSSNVTLYNRTLYYEKVLQYYADSGMVMDNNSTIINDGYTVLNQTLVNDVNVTGTAQLTGATTVTDITLAGAVQRSNCIDQGIISCPDGSYPNCNNAPNATNRYCGYFLVLPGSGAGTTEANIFVPWQGIVTLAPPPRTRITVTMGTSNAAVRMFSPRTVLVTNGFYISFYLANPVAINEPWDAWWTLESWSYN